MTSAEDFRQWHEEVFTMISEGLPSNIIVAKIRATATTREDVANYLEHLKFSAHCLEQDVSGHGIVEMNGVRYDLDAFAAGGRPTLARLRDVIAQLEGA